MKIAALFLAIAATGCEPERLPVECARKAPPFAVTLDGEPWIHECGHIFGSGFGATITDMTIVGFDAEEIDRKILEVNVPIGDPRTIVLPEAGTSVTLTVADRVATAISGELVLTSPHPDWHATFDLTLDDGVVLEGELAFRYGD